MKVGLTIEKDQQDGRAQNNGSTAQVDPDIPLDAGIHRPMSFI